VSDVQIVPSPPNSYGEVAQLVEQRNAKRDFCKIQEGKIMKQMWEILVPTMSNEGKPFSVKFHRVWDNKVKAISGGLTILTPTKGKWVSPCGKEFIEKMIPVRIICNKEEIHEIIDFTMKYYNQEAILAYKISEEVILKHKNQAQSKEEKCSICSSKDIKFTIKNSTKVYCESCVNLIEGDGLSSYDHGFILIEKETNG
jgi:hypothetical protein